MNGDVWQRWMFRGAFLFTFVSTSVAAISGAVPGVITTFATVGIVGMVLTRISDLVSIEAFGLRAELQKKINEANATIEQLQELAVAVAQPVVTNLGIQGHFVQLKYLDRYNMRETINGLLLKIGVHQSDISNINSAFDQMFRQLLVKRILGDITDEEERSSGRAERLKSVDNIPISGEIKAYLEEFDLLSKERRRYLEELEFFENNGKLRNPTILD